MAVTLNRAYGPFASGATVVLPDATEAALIAQGLAVAAVGAPADTFQAIFAGLPQFATVGGNFGPAPVTGMGNPAVPQGPRILPNVPINAFASMGTSAVHVAGSWYRSEIQVPHLAQWTGFQVLNGATAATDNLIAALWDSAGNLITNSAVAGILATGANAFQQLPFVNAVLLTPGRYFIGIQANGTTTTTRRQAAAAGGNTMTSLTAGVFGTVPATFTPPTTFTADVGPIGSLYQ